MSKKIKSIIAIFIIAIAVLIIHLICSRYSFNDFNKSEHEIGKTKFYRDSNEKFDGVRSFVIQNDNYNDAMFSKEIAVKPNVPYRVTCKVKTQDVENKELALGGAQISIADTTESSVSITGTNSEWTNLEMCFNSKTRDKVEIGFRLGGFDSLTKGKAWFTDFKIEAGTQENSNEWNMACFFIDNVSVDINENGQSQKVNVSLSNDDKRDMISNMQRYANSCYSLSDEKMKVNYEIIEISTPLTTISYDDTNGYFVAPKDIKPLIEEKVKEKEYDYIFAVVRMGGINKEVEIPTYDWIGLGGMDYYGIGFSNIRLPNDKSDYIYKYDGSVNTFPEEVFIHEFLHTLERESMEEGYNIPQLHDYEQYGYENKVKEGLKQWYGAYMTKTIKTSDGQYVGLPESVFKPVTTHKSEFEYTYDLNQFKEPKNIIEHIRIIFGKIMDLFEYIKTKNN